jgi:hypothetical protein
MFTVRTRTTSPWSIEFWKYTISTLLGRTRGPYSVRDSLIRGLIKLKLPHELNPPRKDSGTTLVLSGIQALEDACLEKRAGRAVRIIAGPNVTVSPNDRNNLMRSPEIDIILVPAKWVAEAWSSIAPELNDKLRVWPSGTEKTLASKKTGDPIIYLKKHYDDLFLTILPELRSLGWNPRVFKYGNFSHGDFITSLETAPFMVYLGGTESQGLALQEAWARDVPTFVKDTKTYKTSEVEIHNDTIAAPYLTADAGGFFTDIEELKKLIAQKNQYSPAAYHDENLSDEASVKKLISIINEIKE